MKKHIAFFDFDGTITRKDTLLEFIRFCKGNIHFYLGFFLNGPFLIAYKTGILSNQKAKERILTFFFGKMPLDEFQRKCGEFVTRQLPDLLRPKAMEEIRRLKAKDVQVIVVSASPENWILPWTNDLGIGLIATRLKISNDRLTGKIDGRNCYGREKVTRIKNQYNLDEYASRLVYGDSRGDLPMMQLATASFFKPFR